MRKVYGKPYFEVVEYIGDYGYASSSTNSCKYLTCLIGSQSEDVSDSSLVFYKFTSSDGTVYYVWYKNYGISGGGPMSASTSEYSGSVYNYSSYDDYNAYLYYLVGLISGDTDDMALWHVATDADGVFNES